MVKNRNSSTYCDDGNNKEGDGCSSQCRVETGFECSGGNVTSKDVCREICGDGKNMGVLECDDGNILEDDGCNSRCQKEAFYVCFGGSPTTPDKC
jgi:cysteine-rich repeat protein